MRGRPTLGQAAAPLAFGMLAVGIVATAVAPLTAQTTSPPDTTTVHDLGSIVVTADRTATQLARSTASVSLIRGEELRRLPVSGLADALALIPGFAFLRFDGLGLDPQPTVRGFYGGGETDYVLLLVDGRPLNTVETGRIPWQEIPLSAVESIEVMRGGASSLYGDAAIGGVVNVVTRRGAGGAPPANFFTFSGGSHSSFEGGAAGGGIWGGRPFTLSGDLLRTDGFRDHAERTQGSVGASLGLVQGAARSLTLSALSHWRDSDEPGALTGAELEESRSGVAPFHRFDRTEERTYRVALEGEASSLRGTLAAEHRSLDQVRTLRLSPGFGDTQNRLLDVTRLLGTAQVAMPSPVREGDQLLAGMDASVGWLDTEYHGVLSGDAEAYTQSSGERGELQARGEGRRAAAAAFFQYDLNLGPAARVTLGARADGLWDEFEPRAPSEGERSSSRHTAFSPKAGVNLRYLDSEGQTGHWYANVARSFKAPTIDQLYDQRALPVPFPPFSVTISNGELEPQRGTSYEMGLYHRAGSSGNDLVGELTLSVYRMDMTDELDFDVESLRFVNIGQSRHEGVESGLTLYRGDASAFLNYTYQGVTARSGEFDGNYLKAIPRHLLSGGTSAMHSSGVGGALTFRSARTIFLDDANTIELPDYTTVDARLTYTLAGVTVVLDALNLFDETYSSTGFPDPGGSEVLFFHPAAGRTVKLGVRVGGVGER